MSTNTCGVSAAYGREHRGQAVHFPRLGDEIVRDGSQSGRSPSGLVLDPHGEAAAGADAFDRGRRNDHRVSALDAVDLLLKLLSDDCGRPTFLRTLCLIVQDRKQNSRVACLRPRRAGEAGECGDP